MAKDVEVRLLPLDGNDDAPILLDVASKAQLVLREANLMKIPMSEAIPTIVEVYLHQLLQAAATEVAKTGKTVMINVFDMFEIGYHVAEDEESEKGGNITPAFRPLGMAKTTGKDDESQSEE